MMMYWDFSVPVYDMNSTLMERLRKIAYVNKGAEIPFKDLRVILGLGDNGLDVSMNVLTQALNYTASYAACNGVPHGFERIGKSRLWRSIVT